MKLARASEDFIEKKFCFEIDFGNQASSLFSDETLMHIKLSNKKSTKAFLLVSSAIGNSGPIMSNIYNATSATVELEDKNTHSKDDMLPTAMSNLELKIDNLDDASMFTQPDQTDPNPVPLGSQSERGFLPHRNHHRASYPSLFLSEGIPQRRYSLIHFGPGGGDMDNLDTLLPPDEDVDPTQDWEDDDEGEEGGKDFSELELSLQTQMTINALMNGGTNTVATDTTTKTETELELGRGEETNLQTGDTESS